MANFLRLKSEARYNRSTEMGMVVGSRDTLLATLNRLFPKRGDQAKLAEALGYAPATVNRWFKGSREPDLDDLDRIAKYAGFHGAADLLVDLSDPKATAISPRKAWLILEQCLPPVGRKS